jgi:hypothetical protein
MRTSETEKLEGRRCDSEDALEENNSCKWRDQLIRCSYVENDILVIPWLSRSFSTTAHVSATWKFMLGSRQLNRNSRDQNTICTNLCIPGFVFQNLPYENPQRHNNLEIDTIVCVVCVIRLEQCKSRAAVKTVGLRKICHQTRHVPSYTCRVLN